MGRFEHALWAMVFIAFAVIAGCLAVLAIGGLLVMYRGIGAVITLLVAAAAVAAGVAAWHASGRFLDWMDGGP